MPTYTDRDHLEAINALLARHPEGISVGDIAETTGVNRNSVARHLDILAAEGKAAVRTVGPTKLYSIAAHEPFAVQLELFKRAMDAASCGISIADARKPDMPLIYVNAEFETITGYSAAECLGKNCRFLQGKRTSKRAVENLRRTIAQGEAITVSLLNYRKDGTPFMNELRIAPIRAQGIVTHYVGIQTVLE